MKPNRVPEDLIQAGFDAIRAWYADHPSPNAYLDDRTQMRIVLAAALTLHDQQVEQQVRERIAAELWELPIVQHLGIYGSGATIQHMENTAEAALRGVLMFILHPDRIPGRHAQEAVGGDAEEPPWIDCGDGWKVRRPTADLSGLRGPFTGLLGPFGLHGDGNEVVADDAGDPS